MFSEVMLESFWEYLVFWFIADSILNMRKRIVIIIINDIIEQNNQIVFLRSAILLRKFWLRRWFLSFALNSFVQTVDQVCVRIVFLLLEKKKLPAYCIVLQLNVRNSRLLMKHYAVLDGDMLIWSKSKLLTTCLLPQTPFGNRASEHQSWYSSPVFEHAKRTRHPSTPFKSISLIPEWEPCYPARNFCVSHVFRNLENDAQIRHFAAFILRPAEWRHGRSRDETKYSRGFPERQFEIHYSSLPMQVPPPKVYRPLTYTTAYKGDGGQTQ